MTRQGHSRATRGEPADPPPSVERIGPGDLAQLATDVGPVAANVGAVLHLDALTA